MSLSMSGGSLKRQNVTKNSEEWNVTKTAHTHTRARMLTHVHRMLCAYIVILQTHYKIYTFHFLQKFTFILIL